MPTERKIVSDGWVTLEGGIDSGWAPTLIGQNQCHWAINTTFRGSYPKARPGILKRTLDFPDDDVSDDFSTGYFQGAGTYYNQATMAASIAVSVSGRIFLINVSNDYMVSDITISGDANQANTKHAWFQQAETWLVVQNNLNRPFLYNGASSRRTFDHEVPIGGPMAYGKGRLWVARGNLYFGGDLVWSDPTLGPNSVIKFTENEFLNEGGAFAVPDGPITGMAFAANLDTSLGDGDLLVFTSKNVYAFDAPIDRTVWKNLDYPLQRFAGINFGSMNHESIVSMNGDLIFRSQDGVRSLLYARRDFNQWGNSPISRQARRALQYDTLNYLYAASAVNFDNRMLMTVQPHLDQTHGVWHSGVVSLDYDLVSGMGSKLPPSWEGVWTGVRILQMVTLKVNNVDRMFYLVLGDTDRIELWEQTRGEPFDFDGNDNVETQWVLETKSYSFGIPMNHKRLYYLDLWFSGLMGEFEGTVLYRQSLSECWTEWGSFEDCAQYRNCDPVDYGECQEVRYFRQQVRVRRFFPEPDDVRDNQTGGFTRDGYSFQMRLEFTGRATITAMLARAQVLGDDLSGDMSSFSCATVTQPDCPEECPAIECCDPNDFDYSIDTCAEPTFNQYSYLFDATQDEPFEQELDIGGSDPLTVTVCYGELPDGLSIVGTTIQGTPTQEGIYTFRLCAENECGEASHEFTITVAGPACDYDMQVEWTPPEEDLSEMMGFQMQNDDGGIETLTFNQATLPYAIDFSDCETIQSMSFPNMTTMGSFRLFSCGAITSIDLPSLTGNTDFIQIRFNAALTTINVPNWIPLEGESYNFSDNALDEATVNMILARFVANAAFNTGTITLNGGTNAAPAGQGALDKAELQARGVTVNTN